MTRTFTADRGIKVPVTTAAAADTVKGWLIPIYTESRPDGRQMYGLGPKDFQKVVRGYACSECLADFGGVYLASCPACGHERDAAADVVAEPDYWKPDPNDPDRAA